MDSDDDESLVFVFPVDLVKVGKGANAVDAGIVPKVVENDLPLKRGGGCSSPGIDPSSVSIEGERGGIGVGRGEENKKSGDEGEEEAGA